MLAAPHVAFTVRHGIILLAGMAAVAVILNSAGLYALNQLGRPADCLGRTLRGAGLAFLVLSPLAFPGLDNPWPDSWFALWAGLSLAALGLGRMALCRLALSLGRAKRLQYAVAIVGGDGPQVARLRQQLEQPDTPWNTVIGVFADQAGLDDLVQVCRSRHVDDVIIALPWSEEDRILKVARRLEEVAVHIRLAPDLLASAWPRASVGSLAGVPVLDIVAPPLAGWRAGVKAMLDRVLAAILVVVLAPLLLLIALAVKLDSPGPVLFRQPRYGFNNRIFQVAKFRTMHHHRPPEPDTPQATRADPRVTRVGAILRRTSLDELPQLFNVLAGSMSLVGPRPHAVAHNRLYGEIIDGYFQRHKVKPGMTGWAQVHGLRGETDTPDKMRRRVEHDIYYVENWSVLLDLRILAMTAVVVLFDDAAY